MSIRIFNEVSMQKLTSNSSKYHFSRKRVSELVFYLILFSCILHLQLHLQILLSWDQEQVREWVHSWSFRSNIEVIIFYTFCWISGKVSMNLVSFGSSSVRFDCKGILIFSCKWIFFRTVFCTVSLFQINKYHPQRNQQ